MDIIVLIVTVIAALFGIETYEIDTYIPEDIMIEEAPESLHYWYESRPIFDIQRLGERLVYDEPMGGSDLVAP